MPKPNFLVIYTDDMRDDFVDYMPNVMMRIARFGRIYRNARVNQAVCPTSRYTMFTQMPLDHDGGYAQPLKVGTYNRIPDSNLGLGTPEHAEHSNNIGAWLQGAGYRTLMIGKYMNFSAERNPKPLGWDDWKEFVGDDSYHRLRFDVSDGAGGITSPAGTMGAYSAASVNAFMDASIAAGKPFFAYWAPPDPHLPFDMDPADAFRFDHVDWPITFQEDVSLAPSWVSNYAGQSGHDSITNLQNIARQQLKELAELDRHIGTVLDHLESIGQIDNTYIIFTSDNGMKYGEHRSQANGIAKNDFFSVGCRVPLVARGPGIVRGSTQVPMVVQFDIGRTILEQSGATPGRVLPHMYDGPKCNAKSLVGLDPPADRHILMSRGGSLNGSFISTNPYRGNCIVGPQYWLARYLPTDTASDWTSPVYPDIPIATDTLEMYDYVNDPHEHVNLGNSVSAPIVAIRNALVAKLDAMLPV